jgi:hypothetical protein
MRQITIGILIALVATFVAPVDAQTTRPAEEKAEQLKARVVSVAGAASWAPAAASPTDQQAWKAVQVGDEYDAGTQIKTSLRSAVVLTFGDETVVKIERMTLASIDQFHKSATTKTTRLGLGYGAVRAGVAEGALRSDFAVDSPVATLSKRGTDGIYFYQEPRTGRFVISLARAGELEILHRIRQQLRLLRRGENVTQRLLGFILRSQLDRNFNFFTGKLTDAELQFEMRNTTGLSILNPGKPFVGQVTETGSVARRQRAASPPSERQPAEAFFGTQLTGLVLP